MDLETVVNQLAQNFNPYSIFLYGSKATNTDTIYSDYEIGVIFEDNYYVSRNEISNLINNRNYSIFPFRLSEVRSFDIDTPFQKNIYMNILINGGSKTLYGVPVLEELKAPTITTKDLLADINFNLGIALSAVRVYKSGNLMLANDLFYKSCLYATRDFIYYHSNKLCLSYNEIYDDAQKIEELREYKELLDMAHYLRNHPNEEMKHQLYYKNISYINKFILKNIK